MATEQVTGLLFNITDKASVLYDGGGANNALQLEANSAAVVAGGAAVIDADGSTTIDIQVVNAAAGESCTLLVTEYSNGTPTVTNQIRQIEVSIPTTDLAAEINLLMVGLSTATGYAKAPVRVRATPGAFVMISLAAESAAGAKYVRYQFRQTEDEGVDAIDKPSTANIPGTGVTVGAVSSLALAANAGRIIARLTNDSEQIIYLRYGAAAEMNKGDRLNANGGSVTITKYTGAVNAICADGGANLCVTEI